MHSCMSIICQLKTRTEMTSHCKTLKEQDRQEENKTGNVLFYPHLKGNKGFHDLPSFFKILINNTERLFL